MNESLVSLLSRPAPVSRPSKDGRETAQLYIGRTPSSFGRANRLSAWSVLSTSASFISNKMEFRVDRVTSRNSAIINLTARPVLSQSRFQIISYDLIQPYTIVVPGHHSLQLHSFKITNLVNFDAPSSNWNDRSKNNVISDMNMTTQQTK